MSKAVARNRFVALVCALVVGAPFAVGDGAAQQASPATPSVSQAAPAAPASPAPPAGAPATPPAATPPASTPGASPADGGQPSDDSSTGQTLDMTAHPAAYSEGKANWSEGFSALTGAFDSINAELTKSGVAAAGRPIAVFVETDDTGFSYRAMIPIEKALEGKTALSQTVKLGETPAGKAMKFEHRGSYEDIDSTYEAITAYLDEKGLEAANLFVEEYLNDVKTPDDPNLQVNIYVLLK
ncbi:MAG: GyrI-like domain-containing protein [Roseiarcus sp.]|jgi:effector-binding domain-containing protein